MNLRTEREVHAEGNPGKSSRAEDRAPGLWVVSELEQEIVNRPAVGIITGLINPYLTYSASTSYVCRVEIKDQVKGKM